jgi:hypothetical protein
MRLDRNVLLFCLVQHKNEYQRLLLTTRRDPGRELMEGFQEALKCVSDEYEQLPESDELTAKIHKKFLAYYTDPKLSGLSHLLSQEISLDVARQLAFSPLPSQIRSPITLLA